MQTRDLSVDRIPLPVATSVFVSIISNIMLMIKRCFDGYRTGIVIAIVMHFGRCQYAVSYSDDDLPTVLEGIG